MSASATSASAPGARARAVAFECARQALSHSLAILASTIALVALVGFLLHARVPTARLAGWTVAICALLLVRLAVALRFRARAPTGEALRPWIVAHAVTLTASSLVWGSLILLGERLDDPVVNTVALVFVAGHSAGASQSLVGTPKTFFAILGSLLGPSLLFFFTSGVPEHRYLGLTVVVYLLAIANIGVKNHRLLRESIELRFGNLDLVERLTAEKARADAAREAAEQARAAKDRFLAAASHDIRQPMHAALLFLGALEQRAGDGDRDLVGGLRVSLTAARQMLDALLDISKLDAGVVERHDAPCAAAALGERVAALLGPVAERRGLTLRVRAPADLWMQTDVALCERVVMNLTSNALEHTQRGGVLVAFRRRRGRCLVQVWDTGVGIAERDREAIFEEFKQIGPSERDGSRGSGLGLSIVRRLCALLGSEVAVRSELGRGSVFGFEVGSCAAPTPDVADSSGAASASARGGPAAVTASALSQVLVVDDNAVVRDGLSALLGAWGYRVAVACDVDEACRVASTLERVDLALVDYRLPDDKTGLDAIAALRATLGREIRAVIITGDTSPDRIREAADGGHPVLWKPLPPDVLRSTVESALGATPASGRGAELDPPERRGA